MERGVTTHPAGNGAPIIHDFEIVFQGLPARTLVGPELSYSPILSAGSVSLPGGLKLVG